MTATHTHRQIAPDVSTAGLLASLASNLPNPRGALGRAAMTISRRLAEGLSTPGDRDRAAALLARLLDAADVSGCSYPEDGLLDAEFDA